jgi:hypothetical protein
MKRVPAAARSKPRPKPVRASVGGASGVATTAVREGAPLGALHAASPAVGLGAGLQPKLVVNPPDDVYEQEADAAADSVMRMAEPAAEEDTEEETVQTRAAPGASVGLRGPVVQRYCPECAPKAATVQREPELAEDPEEDTAQRQASGEEEVEEESPVQLVQRRTELPAVPDAEVEPEEAPPAPAGETDSGEPAGGEEAGGEGETVAEPEPLPEPAEEEAPDLQTRADGNGGPPAAPSTMASVQQTLHATRGGGRPLNADVRSEMERGFGRDLGGVRVHTDGAAGRMNRDLKARAFTHRSDIYFAPGEYRPEAPGGRRLLAHELAHTIQQGAVSDTIQRYTAPVQDVTPPGPAERPDDGAEVEGRMSQKIADDENVKNQDDLSEEERAERSRPDRGEVRRETGALKSSGESSPSVDRGAEAQDVTAEQQAEIDAQMQEEAAEAGEEGGEGEEAEAEQSDADAAAARAIAAEGRAAAVQVPAEPQPFREPRIEAPVDSVGESLPRNSQIDTQVRGLAYIGGMLRDKGYQMKRHGANQKMASHGMDAVVERQREDLANAVEGTSLIEAHTEARAEIAETSHEAQAESVSRQQFVAAEAPGLAAKADEGQQDSGALADEAGSKAARSQSEIPDDPDARADAQEQAGEMTSTAEGAASMDQAIRQTGERARQYEADAATAAAENEESDARIAETEDAIAQTEARVAEMHAANEESEAAIDAAADGPERIRQDAERAAQSGDELIAASIVMEEELLAIQNDYLSDMRGIESREEATERLQREQEEAAGSELSPEEAALVELAGLSDEEQEARIAEMEQPEREGLLAALDRMIQQAPESGTDETEGRRLTVDTGLAPIVSEAYIPGVSAASDAIRGPQGPDPRAEEIQAVEERRTKRVGGVLDVADRNMGHLTAAQQRMLAERLVAESIRDDIANISVLQMGREMIAGMIDPRMSLASIVGGFEKMATGLANIGNLDAWRRDPLGNLLQVAADITTGLAMIFSTILGLAAMITALMVVLTIVSWGVLSPVTGPVIAWMGTVMTYAGWGAIITGALAIYFNYLAYIKNLHDAGTAETARELFGNTEQMRQNATDGFQGAMAVAAGVGGVKMGPRLSSPDFFAAVPRSPAAAAGLVVDSGRSGLAAAGAAGAALAHGARALFAGGRAGLVRFRNRIQATFRRRPAGRPRTADVDTPRARQRQQADLDAARNRRLADLDEPQVRAELREAGRQKPRAVDRNSEHFRDYDVEVRANGHTYRRRRDGRGWCRFSSKECFGDLDLNEGLPDQYIGLDPAAERAMTRATRAEPGGRQAQRDFYEHAKESGIRPQDIRRELREGLGSARQAYMGRNPRLRGRTGKTVIDRMRDSDLIRGKAPNERVLTVGPDGKTRWYSIRDTQMGHTPDAVIWWNETGRHLGPKHPRVLRWMKDPDNYALQHKTVNMRAGGKLGHEHQYLPPTRV